MAIDAWFPLIIYYVDLEDGPAHKEGMIRRVQELHANSGTQRTSPDSAWTGDIHNVERIHSDAAFAWINEQIGHHVYEYLKLLGHDLAKIDVYFQRSWPVIAGKDQRVSRHSHPNAHLSAVYYVAAPQEAEGGELRFFNDSKPNELCSGIGSNMTGGYKEYNFTNYQSATYRPTEGRLLIFPAKQAHSVDPHQSEAPRISLSFDLVITSREGQSPGLYEFLTPPPAQWGKAGRPNGIDENSSSE